MARLDVAFRPLSPDAVPYASPYSDDPPIEPGAVSEWAIRKVVVSRADNEWPNVLAWIIARFFVNVKDAAAFMGVSEPGARAILGRGPADASAASGEGPVTDEDLLMIRESAALLAWRFPRFGQQLSRGQLPLFEQLCLGLADGKAVLGERASDLSAGSFLDEVRRLCENVQSYGGRGGLYLDASQNGDRHVHALCSTVTAMWNFGALERLMGSRGVEIFLDEDRPPPVSAAVVAAPPSTPPPVRGAAAEGDARSASQDGEGLMTRARTGVAWAWTRGVDMAHTLFLAGSG